MAIYRNVSIAFWSDPKVDDEFTPEDKYFYLYLLTNPQTNICGCYEVSIKQMSTQTGYSKDTVERLICRFEEVHKIIKYGTSTKEVLVLNWHKYNWGKSPKLIAAVQRNAKYIKNRGFRKYVLDMLNAFVNNNGDIGNELLTYDPDCENDTGVDTDGKKDANAIKKEQEHKGDDIISAIWEYYPRKKGRNGINQASKIAISQIGKEHMERAVKRYAAEVVGKDEQYILLSSTFFNGRYNDYLDQNYVPAKTREYREKDMMRAFMEGDA